ncbi:hypothetical protein [Sphaerisporangium perillae]|uniref:hypothetical protein n=1 Tax=Sphaerisporangium perillae TaxID=2935860 RepID=UPI00200F3CC9|nr:hypothetical protein [Sphaerisporangium perillae]
MVVPWARDDAETMEAQPRLLQALESALGNVIGSDRHNRPWVRQGPADLEQFATALPQIARTAVTRHLWRPPAYPPSGRSPLERPRLQGPLDPFEPG